ncbi:NARE ribosyltransferase, partial [Hippolais icterina]|nr:NARE ribosyltransferase [Hippolais icterina]
WPLPAMAPLAQTLALLAMAVVATATIEVVPLDMARDSFDDQYRGCGPAMTAALPALNRSEFQQNPLFAEAWQKAAALWQRLAAPTSPLSLEQAIAVTAYMMNGRLHSTFNDAVREARRSAQHYREDFPYKTLHFLLTQAVVTLKDAQKEKCHEYLHFDCGVWVEAKLGDTVRFGQFKPIPLGGKNVPCPVETVIEVYTCHGVDIGSFTGKPGDLGLLLIPPFETFEVTVLSQEGDKSQIQLRSTGTRSNYNCEWQKGDSTGDSLG